MEEPAETRPEVTVEILCFQQLRRPAAVAADLILRQLLVKMADLVAADQAKNRRVED
jgi:hypothetical protein